MYNVLKDIKENGRTGDFLFPAVPAVIKGKISFLSQEMVVVDSKKGGKTLQYITHPNNVYIVQRADS